MVTLVEYRGEIHMDHWFTLTLNDTMGLFETSTDDKFDDAVAQIADQLFDAGCDDGTLFTREGAIFVGFAREAPTLREAVTSAIADVQSAGYRVSRVTIDTPPELQEINAQLASGSVVKT